MKKNIFVLTSLMLTLGCGCDSFLDETNYSDVTSEGGYYDTEAGLNAVVNACYTPLRFWAGKEDAIGLSETGTDIIAAGSGCVDNNMAAYTQSLDGTNSACTFYFDRFYAAINWCNTAIFHAQTVPNPSNDEILATTLNKREAEARVLRTFYYWILTETFGDTYYTDQPSTSIVMNPVKTSTDNIYQYMFDDLDWAIKSKLSTLQNDGGRVTIWTAKALKARLLLTRASEKNDVDMYGQAYDLAKDVIENGPFELAEDFASIWDMKNSDGNSNKEVIWYVDYSTNQLYNSELDDKPVIRNGGNNAHLLFCMKYDDQPGMTRTAEYGRPFNRYMPTRYLVDLFDEEKDQRYAGSFRNLWIMNNEKGKGKYTAMTDTAIYIIKGEATKAQRAWAENRYQLFDRNDVYKADGSTKNMKQYLELSKFADPTRASKDEDRSTRDGFMIRIAEMYLIAAEAGAKANKADALDYMNKLRMTRAISGYEDAMRVELSQIQDIDFILDERARELAGEQLRWFDLKRFGKEQFVKRIKKCNPDAANVDEHHWVRPFPQTFLDAIENKTEFTQNTGYK